MRLTLSVCALLIGLAAPAWAQSDPCAAAQPPFQVTSGAPFTITWLGSDPTLTLPMQGYFVAVDNAPRVDVGLSVQGSPCAASSANPGKLPNTYRTASGVAKGAHQVTITGWYYVPDPNTGLPTSTVREVAVAVPFDAADPVVIKPAPSVSNIVIKK